jgi:hypothetical protein
MSDLNPELVISIDYFDTEEAVAQLLKEGTLFLNTRDYKGTMPVVDEAGNEVGKEETDVNFIEHARITIEATLLRDIVSQLTVDKNYGAAFEKGLNLMYGAKKWDLDTLAFYMNEGRIAIPNNDFSLVKERIVTGRNTLYILYLGSQPRMKRSLERDEELPTKRGGRRPLYG